MVTVHERASSDDAPRQPAAPEGGLHAEFETFYAAGFRGLVVQLYAYTNDLAAAQDVVQEAFLRALTRWDRVARFDDPTAWVRRVAWNIATSRWRRGRTVLRFLRHHREEHVPEPSPDRVALAGALSTLPSAQRRAVILFYLADLSIRDIAGQEGVSENAVKTWLRRARAALADRLTDREDPVERP